METECFTGAKQVTHLQDLRFEGVKMECGQALLFVAMVSIRSN